MAWRITALMGHDRGTTKSGSSFGVELVDCDKGEIYQCGSKPADWNECLTMLGEPSSVYGMARVGHGIWASSIIPGECPKSWEEAMFRLYPSRYPWMSVTPSPEPQPDDDSEVAEVYPDETTFRIVYDHSRNKWTTVAACGDCELVTGVYETAEQAEDMVNSLTRLHAGKVNDAGR